MWHCGRYVPPRCWADLYAALSGAEKLIYITGWSVNAQIHLVRGQDRASNVPSRRFKFYNHEKSSYYLG